MVGAIAPQRLALFLADLGGGGAERVMVRLANAFSARGYAVDLLVAHASGPWLGEVASGVHLRELGGGGVLAALPRLVAHLRKARPCALLATLDHANLVAVWAGALAGGRTRVVVRQASDLPARRATSTADAVIGRLLPATYRRADAVITLAEAMRSSLVTALGLDPDRVSVIPNPLAPDALRQAAADGPGHPWLTDGGAPVVLSVGRLEPKKDLPTLLRAMAAVRERRPARLMIAGEGPERAALVRLAGDLGLSDVTAFVGFVPNPYPLLRGARVLAMTSRLEGMPNVILEAMSLGTPVVATDCPTGPREVLEGGRLGALVPVGDAAAVAAALERVLDGHHPASEDLRAAMGAYALDRVVDLYLASLFAPREPRRAA